MNTQANGRRGYMPPSKRDNWGTPRDLFSDLEREFGPFDLDAAASDENALCKKYYSIENDSLQHPWLGRVYVNPPYGRGLGDWYAKAESSILAGDAELVVMLLPAHTSLGTRAFHRFVWIPHEATENPAIRPLMGRLRFVGAPAEAPFPSMLVIWQGDSSICSPLFNIPFTELPQHIHTALLGRGSLQEDEAIRIAAGRLKSWNYTDFGQMGRDDAQYKHIKSAIALGATEFLFDKPSFGQVRAVLPQKGKQKNREDWEWETCVISGLDQNEVMSKAQAIVTAGEHSKREVGIPFDASKKTSKSWKEIDKAIGRLISRGRIEENSRGEIRLG